MSRNDSLFIIFLLCVVIVMMIANLEVASALLVSDFEKENRREAYRRAALSGGDLPGGGLGGDKISPDQSYR